LRHAAPGLVAAAEAHLRGQPVDPAIVAEAVEGLRAMPGGDEIETVVLACTHFPLLAAELGQALGPHVRMVDGASGIARRIADLTAGQEFVRSEPDLALTTGPVGEFAALAPALAAYGIERIERV
jgi:glutamate racemase